MSTLRFMAALAGIDAIASTAGGQCAVCKSCKGLICKVQNASTANGKIGTIRSDGAGGLDSTTHVLRL